MPLFRLALLALAALLPGCLIDRTALGGPREEGDGGGPTTDAFLAATEDAPGLDAPAGPVDAAEAITPDAPDRVEPDAAIPSLPDASMGPDAYACLGASEACNARDDDCDTRVDESACGGPTPIPGVTISCAAFTHAGHVYQFCKAPLGVPWEAAQMLCAYTGVYDLVRIDDNAENERIDSIIDVHAWLGLNDRDTENWFVWADGTALGGGYDSWAMMEPSSMRSGGDYGQNCVVMRGAMPVWEDRFCGVIAPDVRTDVTAFVCEAAIVP